MSTYKKEALNLVAMAHDGISYGECLPYEDLLDNKICLREKEQMKLTPKLKKIQQEQERKNIAASFGSFFD